MQQNFTDSLAMRDVFMRPGRAARMYAENDDVIYVSSFGEKSHTKSRHMAAISSLSLGRKLICCFHIN